MCPHNLTNRSFLGFSAQQINCTLHVSQVSVDHFRLCRHVQMLPMVALSAAAIVAICRCEAQWKMRPCTSKCDNHKPLHNSALSCWNRFGKRHCVHRKTDLQLNMLLTWRPWCPWQDSSDCNDCRPQCHWSYTADVYKENLSISWIVLYAFESFLDV